MYGSRGSFGVCVCRKAEGRFLGSGLGKLENGEEGGEGARLPKLRLESRGGQLKGRKRCRDPTVGISTN